MTKHRTNFIIENGSMVRNNQLLVLSLFYTISYQITLEIKKFFKYFKLFPGQWSALQLIFYVS